MTSFPNLARRLLEIHSTWRWEIGYFMTWHYGPRLLVVWPEFQIWKRIRGTIGWNHLYFPRHSKWDIWSSIYQFHPNSLLLNSICTFFLTSPTLYTRMIQISYLLRKVTFLPWILSYSGLCRLWGANYGEQKTSNALLITLYTSFPPMRPKITYLQDLLKIYYSGQTWTTPGLWSLQQQLITRNIVGRNMGIALCLL